MDLSALRAKLLQVQNKPKGQKLSDRNVVEIVNKLVSKYGLELVLTASGKEYLTPKRLQKEIEIKVNQLGRVNLLELPSVLNVSVEAVEKYSLKVAEDKESIHFVTGQLISDTYLDGLAQEINEHLEEAGQVSMKELTHKYSLSLDFLKDKISRRVGSIIQGQFKDQNVLYTNVYMERVLCKLRGTLRGATKPLQLKDLNSALTAQQVNELIKTKQVKGSFKNNTFTPAVYQQNVKQEIQSFYQSNSFIEYEHIRRVMDLPSSSSVEPIIEKELKGGKYLHSAYVHPSLLERVRNDISEATAGKTMSDLYEDADIPMCIAEEDFESIVNKDLYCIGHFVFKEEFLQEAMSHFQKRVEDLAEETKTPKSKKTAAPVISQEEIVRVLKAKRFLGENEDLYEEFAELIHPKLSQLILQKQKEKKQTNQIDTEQLTQKVTYLQVLCKSLTSIQKKYQNVKPIKVHLTKTLVSEVFNELLAVQVANQGFPLPLVQSNQRQGFINKLPDYLKEIFNSLQEKISKKEPETFIEELIENTKNIPVVYLKPLDKKTERAILHKHKQELKQNARNSANLSQFVDLFYFGVRVKLVDALASAVELPPEVWGLEILRDIYANETRGDMLTEFGSMAIENAKVNEPGLAESMQSKVEDICQFLNI